MLQTLHALFDAAIYHPIFNALAFLVNVIPGADVGIAIILLTITIKLILFPLSLVAVRTQIIMREIDPKLDDRDFVEELYRGAESEKPRNPNLEWVLNFSDLGIYEKKLSHLFVLRRGFN